MENMKYYEAFKNVPAEAKKEIKGGRLAGYTDINPMWRIKSLTEQFGACGIGWKYIDVRKWNETGANDEIAAFVDILLFVKVGGEWSEGIPGTGGSMFVSKERNGLYTNDEAFKMATTDAISVACKSLGIGADVYWEKDRTKYEIPQQEPKKQEMETSELKKPIFLNPQKQPHPTEIEMQMIMSFVSTLGIDVGEMMAGYNISTLNELTREQTDKLIKGLEKRLQANPRNIK